MVLLSLTPLNLLDVVEGREQGNYGNDPKLFMYSAVVVFVHPGQVLTTIQNAVGFFQQQYNAILQGGHSNGWCTLCKLPHYEISRYFPLFHTCRGWHCPCWNHLEIQLSDPSFAYDTAGCDANCMIIWLLHHMWCHDTDYAMLPWHCV